MSGRILNIGSLCIDYVYRVPALAAAGETIASTGRDVFAGGKGLNQSIAAARAGAPVYHFGAVGADGTLLSDTLAGEGVDVDGVAILEGPSGHAFIQVDPVGANAIVIEGGSNRRVPAAGWTQALADAQPTDWVLLQNEINDLPEVIERAAATPARVVLNLAPADVQSRSYPLHLLDMLIVNAAEAALLTNDTDPQAALQSLQAQFPHLDVVLTLGADGALWQAGQRQGSLSAYDVASVDETAAGDAFVGYLVAALASGEQFTEALTMASAAGALACTQAGAAPSIPTREEVLALVASQGRLT